MFHHIGDKIKGAATAICILGIAGSVVSGLIMLDRGAFAIGLSVLLGGSFLSWLAAIGTYGFGQLVKSNENMDARLADIEKRMLAISSELDQIRKSSETADARPPKKEPVVQPAAKEAVPAVAEASQADPMTPVFPAAVAEFSRPRNRRSASSYEESQPIEKEPWVCPKCQEENPPYAVRCIACLEKRP